MTADEAIDGIVRPAVTLVRALVEAEEAVVLGLAHDRVGADSVVDGFGGGGRPGGPRPGGRSSSGWTGWSGSWIAVGSRRGGGRVEVLGAMNRRAIRCRMVEVMLQPEPSGVASLGASDQVQWPRLPAV
jgi:uncharacterized membrane protein